MDKGDVEMLDAEKNVHASDVLLSNESPVEYKNGVKTGKINAEEKTNYQSDSKGENLKDDKSETEDQLNSNSPPEAHDNVVLENETPTIDAGRMIWSYEFPKVKLEVTDSLIGKMPEPVSPMFQINPSTANVGHHSGEASENTSAIMADGEDDEGSLKDRAAFLGKLVTVYQEKAMEFKPPRLWRSVIRLGGYDRLLLQYERHMIQNGELQLPIALPPSSSGVDNEGSGYQISASGRAVKDSAIRCRLGKQEQYLFGYGEVAEPMVKERNANNMPKRAKSLKNTGSLKHHGQNEVEHPIKAVETETSKQ
ncbi:AT-rich interactive domain-containing protein 6-like [Solanum stenotomum]|uniref:AT-rich interactive domain-containing protein 6-like n=1 Tax=Solanum stenotomum TaxID=172797 RepID=UPI0020D17C6A|nr:AT-rich interactive domain-containing protein 6-like [Solanum stenotomum]